MARMVDRSMVKLIAVKRLVTGTLALTAAVALVIATIVRHAPATPQLGLALVIFVGGGIWTLRDGIRLRRELSR